MADFILGAGAVYLAAGLIFAPIFLIFRIGRADPAAGGASIWFRMIILPGVVALWPVMLARWLRGIDYPPTERTAHRESARETRKWGAL